MTLGGLSQVGALPIVGVTLRRLEPRAPAPPGPPSIAVLPGIAEAILNVLSRVENLRVAGGTLSFHAPV